MSLFHEVELAGSSATGRLLLHSMPGRFEPMSKFLAAFEAEEIYRILCLVSDEEIREKSPDYLGLLADPDFAKLILRVPIKDFGVPSDMDSFQGLLDILTSSLNAGRNVLIHCAAGVGRTGMAAICLLTDLGLELEEARHRVYEAHAEPETHEQEAFILNYCSGLFEEE